ncbi:MAG TPA: hypothetical protein GXZ77_07120 [Papillibacter sp.]|jgi:hypothetical protein|nr:hypothetical protein [Papillibacter sp.]
MYNRYIGNTGRVIRMEDAPPLQHRGGIHRAAPVPPPPPPEEAPPPPPQKAANRPKMGSGWPSSGIKSITPNTYASPISGGGFPLSGLLKNFSGGLKDGHGFIRGLFDNLPFGLDLGDILLLLLLLFFYIESGDEEFLIILAFLVFSIIKDVK